MLFFASSSKRRVILLLPQEGECPFVSEVCTGGWSATQAAVRRVPRSL